MLALLILRSKFKIKASRDMYTTMGVITITLLSLLQTENKRKILIWG